jgi:hypothetical protein
MGLAQCISAWDLQNEKWRDKNHDEAQQTISQFSLVMRKTQLFGVVTLAELPVGENLGSSQNRSCNVNAKPKDESKAILGARLSLAFSGRQ